MGLGVIAGLPPETPLETNRRFLAGISTLSYALFFGVSAGFPETWKMVEEYRRTGDVCHINLIGLFPILIGWLGYRILKRSRRATSASAQLLGLFSAVWLAVLLVYMMRDHFHPHPNRKLLTTGDYLHNIPLMGWAALGCWAAVRYLKVFPKEGQAS